MKRYSRLYEKIGFKLMHYVTAKDNIQKIKKEGILPSKDPAYPGYVYVWDSFEEAQKFKEFKEDAYYSSGIKEFVILEVEIPKETRLEIDPEAEDFGYEFAYRFKGFIPKKNIRFDRYLYESKSLKEIEKEARDYYYAAKNPKKVRETMKMRKLEKEWEKLAKDVNYTFGDVLA